MVAGCEIGNCLHQRNIPYPCALFEHLHIIALRRCVRQEAITNFANGLSYINDTLERGSGKPICQSPSRVQIFVSDHLSSERVEWFTGPELAIPGSSTLPTLSWTGWMDSEPSSAAANTRRAGSWIGGPFLLGLARLGVGPLVFSNFLAFCFDRSPEAMQPVD